MGTRFGGRMLWPLLLAFVLTACSNGSGDLAEPQAPPPPPPSQPAQTAFTLGGSVSGLAGGSLVLQNNGAGDLTLATDGSFVFAGTLAAGATYNVTVLTQPATPAQTCTVANGTGTVTASNITNIAVICTTAPRYTIGGIVSGLTGAGLVLQNNGGDNLAITTNGTFTFATALTSGSAYNATVSTQPNGQNCAVRNASGTVAAANVTNLEVACVANQFSVGGTVSGLAGTGLVLQLNGANDLAIVNGGSFAFPVLLAQGATYQVSVKANPNAPSQDCKLTNDRGTIASANVTNVAVACTTKSFTVGGVMNGLAPLTTGAVLQLNGTNDVRVVANGNFTFPKPLLSGTAYTVSVRDPRLPSQRCSVAPTEGTVTTGNVTNIVATCATNTFTVGGTIIGLQGTGLTLLNNGGDTLSVAPGSTSFTFATPLASGATYQVQVGTPPSGPTQACSLSRHEGKIEDKNIDNVVVNCSTQDFFVKVAVTGLLGNSLELTNNGHDTLKIGADGEHRFPTAIPSGAPYKVEVAKQPNKPKQTCTVTAGEGTVGAGDVGPIAVQCATQGYVIGGTVSGLVGTGLVVRNLGIEDLVIATAANGRFEFPTPLQTGTSYQLQIAAQPTSPNQFCYLATPNYTGVVGKNDIDVAIVCL